MEFDMYMRNLLHLSKKSDFFLINLCEKLQKVLLEAFG